MNKKFKVGDTTDSGNFKLKTQITTLEQFWDVINKEESVFARHRMYPSAFFFSWQLAQL